ncbi:MAG: 5,10-methylenetetrahydromethanopterin reductase [Chloroflexota bacterium]|jgi:5,10-methylenetetrahydromethanopterin reductase|nr:5,10-methylenetetrahydromethanopterin reductase [Chloroflexota bacterium]
MTTYGIAMFPQPPADLKALCELVESGPFDQVWIPDERFHRDLGVDLTLAALNTTRARIGSSVTDPYVRHPALTASLMATVDEVSGGRLVVGIGAGASGFKQMGVTQEKPQLAIREMVALMRRLWTGENVDFDGKTTSFHGSLDYTPARPDIPIWIAGRGPHVLQLAGEVADGAMIGALSSAPTLAYALGRIQQGLVKGGRPDRPFKRAIWMHVAVHEDGALAREAVRIVVAGALVSSLSVLTELGVDLPTDLLARLQGVPYGINDPEMLRAAATIPDEVLSHFSVAGSPDEVRARFAELAHLGIDHFAILPWPSAGQTMAQLIAAIARVVG